MDSQGVQFTISLPFERFAELKAMIESQEHWKRLDAEWDYFENDWTPKCWQNHYRVLFLRHRVKKQNKQPVQLELFVPHEQGYEFKLIVTNKTGKAKHILLFHNGRGSQENIFSFEEAASIRHKIVQRAGRLTRPQGYLRLTMSANEVTRRVMMRYLDSLRSAA